MISIQIDLLVMISKTLKDSYTIYDIFVINLTRY